MKGSKIVIGRWEWSMLLINAIGTQIFLNFPRSMTESAGTAGWILAMYVSVLSLICFFLITKLYEPFEGKDLLDIADYIGGNVARVIIGIIIIVFLGFFNFIILREFGEYMKGISLPVSPISFVLLFFISGMVLSAYFGIATIARLGAIYVPLVFIGFLFIIIGASPFFDFTNVLPILGTGAYDLFGKGFLKLSIYSGLIYLFFMQPYLKTNKNFKSVGYAVVISTGIFFVLGALVYIAIIPYPSVQESVLPFHHLSRLISYGRFFQRVESMFVFIWASGALIYLCTGFFFLINVFKKTFKLTFYKPLIIPFAILSFNLSILPSSLMGSIELETVYLRNFAWIITFGLTILLLLIARIIRTKKVKIKS